MKRRIIAVFDADSFFAERFAEATNQKEKVPFTVMAFTSLERIIQFSKENQVEILLIDEKAKQEAEKICAEQIVLLSDGEVMDSLSEGTYPSVYKYQSADQIIREVMACYCVQPVPPAAAVGNKSILIGVYSPVNRCLKTTFSLVLGQLLAKEGKVLYLNLEDCSGLRKLMGQQGTGDFSDVLYYHSQGGCSWARIKSLVYRWDNLDYILPVRYPEDLALVSSEEMAKVLGRIAQEGIYEILVVDLGQFGKKSADILELCSGVYMPIRQDYLSSAKIEEYEEYIKASGHGRILEKTQKLKLPCQNNYAVQGNYLDQILWGELGDYVRQLLKGRQSWK